MTLTSLQKFFMLFLVAFFLTGCGFHLRGPVTLAKPLQNIYVQSKDPYSDLTRNIKQYLTMSGVHLAASPQEATSILTIQQETESQELVSINSSQQTRQYNLKLTVVFDITTHHPSSALRVSSPTRREETTAVSSDAQSLQEETTTLPPQSITETRPLTLQSNQILAGSNQTAQLYRDMRLNIVYHMINQLASKAVVRTLISEK